MVEMDRIVSGKRGWVTRGLREYVGKGDRPCWKKLEGRSSPFEMVEMDRIVSEKRCWVIRGLMEYVGKGDHPPYNHRIVWYLL